MFLPTSKVGELCYQGHKSPFIPHSLYRNLQDDSPQSSELEEKNSRAASFYWQFNAVKPMLFPFLP